MIVEFNIFANLLKACISCF